MRHRTTQAQRTRQAFNAQAEPPVYEIPDTEATEPDTLRKSTALLSCYSAGKDA